VDRFGVEISRELSALGMSVEVNTQPVRGNHLIGRWIGNGPKILLIGHSDTVWDVGTLEKMPIQVQGDIARGPGIYDMKAGILIALYALRLLREQEPAGLNITLIINSDEEEASATSRSLIENEARGAGCALVLEPAGPNNSLKTKRRGTGQFRVHVKGRSAHAGVEPEKGIHAIEDLAHQILQIQSWNRLRNGISVNVGIVKGGTRTNVVPAEAEAEVDLRCDTPEDVGWLMKQFELLTPSVAGAQLEVSGSFDRPPMVRSGQILSLYQTASQIASSFDYPVTEFWTGGASDGNFTAALDIPTLDGLGAEGAGAHALHEHILVSSLPKRANLLYQLILSQIGT
jgi:glutamate carboxypeptidase